MKGASHAVTGTAIGLGTAVLYDAAPAATGLLILLGSVSALAPDLDTNGRLSNRISLHRKWLWYTLASIGVLLGTYSLVMLQGVWMVAGIAVALSLIIAPRFLIKQRFMVMLSGGVLTGIGWFYSEDWLLYFGLFTIICSFLPHRGLTHTWIGLAVFAFIAWELEKSLMINGILTVCTLGYLSHILLDMKMLPFNKKGVKLLQPLMNKEF
ncbi:metal-dependent hydrolase [Jeotgalibacillus sp. R-1-5s-1]|uniref:metal-dependent hydrolase n=1 Tax=Jeotgalibacillus sp. R-1-5s-1 TaxID=2555897 RepID=UPI00141A850C|nr:metal-dependent hydrolase [Jeotgalibacillus sp. R-1-5s-1]